MVKDASNNVIGRYFYDGSGKRVKKVTNSKTTVFVYDGTGKLVAEYSTATLIQNPTTNYTATDPIGSPRVLTNKQGQIVSRRDFMPFGEELSVDSTYRKAVLKYGSADNVRQKFTGYERDIESNLDFAQARMYNFQHGRFTSVDPLKESAKAENPQSWNRYSYSYNNPYKFTDPTGMIPGDYYDREGEYIGTDGLKDNKIYLLNEGRKGTEFPCKEGQSEQERVKQIKDFSTEVGGLVVLTRTEEGKDYTVGEFKTIGGVVEKDIKGVMLEPNGPSTTESGQDKRIPEGVYNVDNYSSKKFSDNFIISNNEVSKDRKILFHSGTNGGNTEGCIMPGTTKGDGFITDSRAKMGELRTFIKSEGASNVKFIIRNRIRN